MSTRHPFSALLTAACLAAVLVVSAGAQSPAARQYRVAKGDTLTSVAKRYGVSIATLAAANGMRAGADLRAGALLTIPTRGGSASASAAPPAKAPTAEPVASTTPGHYRVRPG